MYSIINLSLNKLIMCLAIEIHLKLTFWLIMNKKTKFDLINTADVICITVDFYQRRKIQPLHFFLIVLLICFHTPLLKSMAVYSYGLPHYFIITLR